MPEPRKGLESYRSGFALDTSPFETAIAAVPGMPRFTLLTPADEFSAPLGCLPVRGVVSWDLRS